MLTPDVKAPTESKPSAKKPSAEGDVLDRGTQDKSLERAAFQILVSQGAAKDYPEHRLARLTRSRSIQQPALQRYILRLQQRYGNRATRRMLEVPNGPKPQEEPFRNPGDDLIDGSTEPARARSTPLDLPGHDLPGKTERQKEITSPGSATPGAKDGARPKTPEKPLLGNATLPPEGTAPGAGGSVPVRDSQAGSQPHPLNVLGPTTGQAPDAKTGVGTAIDEQLSVPAQAAGHMVRGVTESSGMAAAPPGQPRETAPGLLAPLVPGVPSPLTAMEGKAPAPAYPPGASQAADDMSSPDGARDGSAAAMPDTATLGQAAKRVLQAIEVEKASFSQEVQAHRTATLVQSESRAQAIAAKTTAKIHAIDAAINGRKTELSANFAAARTAIMAQTAIRKAAARADGDKALASLQKAVETKRKGAIDAAEETASQTEKMAQTESDRAINQGDASVKRVNVTAAQESQKYGKTPEGKAAAAQAIQQLATGVVDKIRSSANDQANRAHDTAGKVAQGLRDSGKQLAASLGGNTAQVEQTILKSVEGAVNRVDAVGQTQSESLKRTQTQAMQSLERARTQTLPAVERAGNTARTATHKIGHTAVLGTEALKASVLRQMTKGGIQVVNKLRQAEKTTGIAEKDVPDASQPLQQGRAQLTRLLTQNRDAAQSGMASVETTFGKEIDGAESKLNGALGGVSASAASSLAQVQTELHNLLDQALNAAREAQQKAVSQYADGLEHQIADAKTKWGQERDKVLAGIRTDVDKNIATQKDVEQKATAEFAKAGQKAAEEAEESVVMGILKGIGKVVLGLVILFAVAGLIYAIAAGLAALGVCAAIPFAIALAIAAVVLLVVAFVLAVIQRTKEMDSVLPADRSLGLCIVAGFAVVAIALGDVVGITPIIEGLTGKTAITQKELTKQERAEKITEGVLTLLLMFIGGRALKGLKGSDPAVEPPKSLDPTVDPTKPVDPIVDPKKPTDPDVDPNRPKPSRDPDLGFEDGRRVMAEEPTADGKHKIKVTEDGECLYCTNCGSLTKEYAIELNDPKNADILAELDNADKIINPKIKAKRMAQIEEKLAKLRKDNPHPNDPTLARAARIQLLARDPAHGGKVTPGSVREAEVAVSLEESGQVPGPIQRDPTGAADFIDGSGKHWDVKGFNSHQPPSQGGFDLATDTAKVDTSLSLGENVMVDTAQMTPGDVNALKAEGAKPPHSWGDRVKFFP